MSADFRAMRVHTDRLAGLRASRLRRRYRSVRPLSVFARTPRSGSENGPYMTNGTLPGPPVPEGLPVESHWYVPWKYGRWK